MAYGKKGFRKGGKSRRRSFKKKSGRKSSSKRLNTYRMQRGGGRL